MKRLFIFCVLLVVPIFVGVVAANDYAIINSTIDGGGALITTGGDYALGGTIGQMEASTVTGGDYSISHGYWTPDSFTIPLAVTLSNASTSVQAVFYTSALLLILSALTFSILYRQQHR